MQMNNSVHSDREGLKAFYLRLTGQAALCGWTIDQEKEVVRDIFIAKMRYKDIQRELCIRPGATPEDSLKSALLQEKGAQTATDLQRQLGSSFSTGNFSQSGTTSGQNSRIKQEPTFSVQGKKLSDRISRAQNSKSKGNNEKSKSCYFCGNRFSANHKQSCPARNVTCRNCSKKGHFAKCCNSKNVANVEAESDETVEENCNFITSDSESEFAVLSVAAEKPNRPIASVRKLEVVNAATGKLRSIQITLRCGQTFFKATVDTGSPASFVNKKTADYILKTVPSAKVFTVQESPIDTVYVDYNRKRIELMGTLVLDVSSLGWHVKSAKFLISENRTRCLLGLDLQPHLGVKTTQVRPERPLVGEVSQSNLNVTSESWKTHFYQKFHRVFTRVGKAKNHKVFSTFKSPLVPIQEKGRRVPVHIQDKVGQEIQKLIQEGHVVKLNKCTKQHFISPIVITAKKDGSVKLAMDAKPMIDQIHKNHYQMPNLLELLDSAAQIITSNTLGDVWFTSLDLKYAFSQIPLSDEVSRHCNFNIVCGEQTGTYRFKTGFYGLPDMPKEFQKAMDNTLQGLSGVFCFLDDILIVSKGSILDHNILVDKVITRMDEEGFALKLSKCDFSLNQLSWLGYDIDIEGYRPKLSKIEAVLALEPPRKLKQLRSFMGILNHLQRFLPNLQVHSDQLRPSLKASNKSKFVWGDCQQTAFSNILQLIANITKMYHYDQSRNSRVKCDASHSGLGAALEQEIEQDVWVPIAFASRFLNDKEKKYSTNE